MDNIFKSLKKGGRVKDSWYGKGTVVRKTKRRCLIQLLSTGIVWIYDVEHVNHFISRGWK